MTGRSRARDRSRPSGGAPLWTPAQLAPYAWYRGDLGITLVGGKVAAWADQSGNGYHLSQSSDPLRPAYDATVASRGNCPAVRTDGTTYLTGSATLPRELSWVVAFGSVGPGYAFAHSNGSIEYHYTFSSGPATHFVRNTAGTSYYRTVNTQPVFVANTNLIVTYDGAAISTRRSGASVAMTSAIGTPPASESIASNLYIGRGGVGSGAALQILEIILAPPLSAAQLVALDAYFARLGRPN